MDTNEKIFYDNIKIAYKVLSSYKMYECLEDLKQEALLGLWKAVNNFDKTKNLRFSTFAYRVIQNEINYYLRKAKKHKNNISLATPICDDLSIEDTLEDEKNRIENLIESIAYKDKYSKLMRHLKEEDKKIIRLSAIRKNTN